MVSEKQNSKVIPDRNEVNLDVSITEFFQALSKSARIKFSLRFTLLAFSFLGISLLLLGVSDRIWETTVSWRIVIFSTGLITALWAMYRLITYSFYYTRKLTWLAKSVRNIYRAKGERLLGIIEITTEDKNRNHSFSPQIFEAAQQKMAQEINSLKIDEIFSWKKVIGPSLGAFGILLMIMIASISYPGLSENAFKRWCIPFASLERKTLTQIREYESESFTVLKDESNTIRFSLSPSSRRKPNYAKLIKPKDSGFHLVSKLNGGIYEFNIPPQSRNFSVDLIVGDYQKKISVKTVTRPRLEDLTSVVKFPQYLSRNSEKLDTLNNQFKVPKSAKITLLGKANRKINQVLIFDSDSSFSENPFSTDFKFNLPALKKDRKYSLLIVDQFGFSPRNP